MTLSTSQGGLPRRTSGPLDVCDSTSTTGVHESALTQQHLHAQPTSKQSQLFSAQRRTDNF